MPELPPVGRSNLPPQNPRTLNDKLTDEQYKEITTSVQNLLEKYGKNPDANTKAKIDRFNKLYNPLVEQYKKNPAKRTDTVRELGALKEELIDALTYSPYMRELKGPNRLDTQAEQTEVRKARAEREQKLEENKRRKEETSKKWDEVPGLEMSYRILQSNGQGSNQTIKTSAKRLLDNSSLLIDLLVYVKSFSEIEGLKREIDLQLRRNDLDTETKSLLTQIKEKVK